MKSPSTLRLALIAAAIGMPAAGFAQSAAPSTQDPSLASSKKSVDLPNNDDSADSKQSDQAVVLSPFEVSVEKDTGYAATDTLGGTRIRTDLKDVAASIGVVTRQFMEDVGATDTGTLLQYTTNAEVGGTNGTYAGLGNGASVDESATLRAPATDQRLRGLTSADNSRDYFVTDIPWDSYNIDRIDILRGPNSILFGLGSPAGMINGSTRNAEFRDTGSTDLRFDSWGSVKNDIDINVDLIPKVLAIRIDTDENDQKYEQKQAFSNDKRIYGTVRFDPQLFKNPSFHTSFKAKFEHGEIDADRPRIVPPNDSITPWWNSSTVSASNPFGGMSKIVVTNPYDPWSTTNTAPGYGLTQSASPNYLPWLSDIANQQQPIFFINGANNQLYQAYGGYINNGAVNSSGAFTGVSNGLVGKNTNGMFYGLGGLPAVAIAYNLPSSQYGQYKTMSLQNSSVFDFYNTLIDGPTASEWENWNAENFDFSQTGWDDRFGIDLTYDHQKYNNGSDMLLGGSPTLTLDVLENLANYYTVPGANGESSITNPNFGRPYVQGANNNGGTSYNSDRKYERGSIFAEFRASDLNLNHFLTKLLGKQRFNGVASDEKYFNENRNWQDYANSQAWAGYWNGNNGSTSAFTDRAPIAVMYLGPSVTGLASPNGANIPGIASNIYLPNAGINAFDTTWQGGTSYGNAYVVPANLQAAFNPATAVTQASNPANYLGWNSNFVDQLQRYNGGQNLANLTLAQKQLRETKSLSGNYQGYFWNSALVVTLGWRYDQVGTESVTAQNQPLDRNILNLDPSVYTLPSVATVLSGHSTSGGAVLHLNDLLSHDPLPVNVSLSYNESSNFQVTSARVDLYGNSIPNPTGKTYEYGTQFSTKDGKFSLRITKYTTTVDNASSGLSNPGGIGTIIQQGLKWRNVFLYQLGGYDLSTAGQVSYRNTWTNAYPNETASQAAAEEDAAVNGWNNIQKWLAAKGFFQAWNFNPTTPSALTTPSAYAANPSAYAPNPATVYAYAAVAPQGFTVTANTQSKGDEFELTANPLPNWRLAFNAAETTAVRSDVGGASLDQFVAYMDSQLLNADGTLSPAGKLPQFGNASYAMYSNVYAPWRSNYALMKLQEGTDASELRKWRFNLISNYSFTHGSLKGFGVGGGYRWQDKVVIGYPLSSAGVFDLTKPYYGPSEAAIDLWVSYEHKLTKKINWKVQLNVRNAFAKDGLIPVSIEPDGKTWATVRTKPTQQFLLNNTFSF